MSRVPTKGIDYTSRDYESFRELLIQKLKEKMPEYTDLSETDAGIVIIEALANGLDIMSLYADIVANDVILPTTQDRSLAVILARCLGYIPYNQTAAVYPQVFVLSKALEQRVQIPKGTKLATKESSDLATLKFETLEDLIIPAGNLGNEKDENGKYLYTVRVAHGETIKNDVLGSSSGNPTQSFRLKYTKVLVDSIELSVKEIDGVKPWKQVDSFIESDENSRVYMTSVDEFDVCTVSFGNGIRGMIPPADFLNNIVATYRVGGGEAGNINANLITELKTNIPYVASTFNLDVITRGYEKEDIESIKQNGPAAFRTRNRLVTLRDYEDSIRMNFRECLAVRALRDNEDRKQANIYIIPKAEGDDLTINDDFMERVQEFIVLRSMIGTTFTVNNYDKQIVDLEAKMYVDEDYDKDVIAEDVEAYIRGVIFAYGNLLFDDYLVKSDLEAEVRKVFKGILSFRLVSPEEDIIYLQSKSHVLTLGNITIEAMYPDFT